MAPCCGNAYACKKCHDHEEDHQMEAQQVLLMQCMQCGLRQPPAGDWFHPIEVWDMQMPTILYIRCCTLPVHYWTVIPIEQGSDKT